MIGSFGDRGCRLLNLPFLLQSYNYSSLGLASCWAFSDLGLCVHSFAGLLQSQLFVVHREDQLHQSQTILGIYSVYLLGSFRARTLGVCSSVLYFPWYLVTLGPAKCLLYPVPVSGICTLFAVYKCQSEGSLFFSIEENKTVHVVVRFVLV